MLIISKLWVFSNEMLIISKLWVLSNKIQLLPYYEYFLKELLVNYKYFMINCPSLIHYQY